MTSNGVASSGNLFLAVIVMVYLIAVTLLLFNKLNPSQKKEPNQKSQQPTQPLPN